MRVLIASIVLELHEQCANQRRTRQHAFDSQLQHTLWRALNQLLKREGLQPTRKTGVVVVHLVLGLIASDAHFISVNHDDVIAGVHMRSVLRLVFTTQASSNFCSRTAVSLIFRIKQQPVVFNILWFGTKSLHVTSPKSGIISREREYYRSAGKTSSTFAWAPEIRANKLQEPPIILTRTH